MNEAQLIKTIEAHIAKSEQAAQKSEQHAISLAFAELAADAMGRPPI
jgi:hypothetical protein